MSAETAEHRCIFCWSQGEMTREHPMSKRVLDLAGFTLDDIHIEIDASSPSHGALTRSTTPVGRGAVDDP